MVWSIGEIEAHALLRQMAADHWGLVPLPEMAQGDRGKPFFPAYPHCHFSLSHSGGLSLCTLSDAPVGADLELVRPRREGLPAYALGEGELAWFWERGSRWEDFYTLWTLKEARVKCTGEGLRKPPRDISVPLLEPGEEAEWEGFIFTALAGEGWRGAVCQGNRFLNFCENFPRYLSKGEKFQYNDGK